MVEDIGALKEKLLTVSSEIDEIKNSFTKGAENLSRIQSLLDIGNIEDIHNLINITFIIQKIFNNSQSNRMP